MLVLFDIDGTLLRSRGVGLRAMKAALESLHPPRFEGDAHDLDAIDTAGRLDPLIWRELLAQRGLDATDAGHHAFRTTYGGLMAEMIAADVAAGLRPAAVVASVGTTGTTAFDPLPEMATVLAAAAGDGPPVWLHVDAAMAGSAMICPEFRRLWDGVESADSLSFNPHKWLGTILDCSLFYVRDLQHLVRVFSSNPSYLQSSADGQVTQFRDWGIPLGRRFRALKLWFHLRLDGVESMQQRVRRDVANAAWLAGVVEATPGWEVVAPVQLQTVCVRHLPAAATAEVLEAHTQAWAAELNRSGAAYVTPSKLDDRWMVRVSVGVESTEREHVARLWELMQDAAKRAEDASSIL